jgi:phosphatidylinositol-3-phosphatase
MTRAMRTAIAIVFAMVVGCGGSGGGGSGGPDSGGGDDVDAPSHDSGGGSNADAPIGSGPTTIYTIVLENHDYAEIIGSSNAPYINSLVASGGLATNYRDTIHPSLGNYLMMISGANQYPGIVDLSPTQWPYFPADQPNLGTQLEAANIPWRSFQESMGTPCKLTDAGRFAPRHDPFLYFKDQQQGASDLCASTNVDYTQLPAALAANTYRYVWITPNLDDDGHDPSTDPVGALHTCDHWLSQEVPHLLASAGYQNGGAIFITWDESEGRNGDDPDQVPMIVLSPRIAMAGMTTSTAYTHASYLATVEDLLGLPRLATVTSTPSMLEFFHP